MLGRFNPVRHLPGWIVMTHDRRLIGIEMDEVARKYRVCYPMRVPLENYQGNPFRSQQCLPR